MLTVVQELEAIRRELERRGVELNADLVLNPYVGQNLDIGHQLHDMPDFTEYADKPKEFCGNILKSFLWSKQREIIEAVRDHPKVSVRSSHGIGKTYVASRAAVWFLYTRPNSIVITTAPAARSVAELIWREIRECVNIAGLPGRCLTTKLELAERWFAIGISTDDANKFQGFHAADILMIVDEAAGVDQMIYDAADGILTTAGSRQLLIGNPTTVSGKFYDTHHKARQLWHTIHVNAFMSPNYTGEEVPQHVKDHLVSSTWAEERAVEWGIDSPLYKVRVLGEFCDQDDAGLIALSWVMAADNFEPLAFGDIVLGADIARQGNCESSVYVRQGGKILHHEAWRKPDLAYTYGRIKKIGREWGVNKWNIDATGMGAKIADDLKADGIKGVNAIIVGTKAEDNQRFCLLRDEIWWNLRELLREFQIGPLKDETTKSQLTSIKYGYDSRGRIQIESKRDLQERSMPSPDRADSLALAFTSTKGKSRRAFGF